MFLCIHKRLALLQSLDHLPSRGVIISVPEGKWSHLGFQETLQVHKFQMELVATPLQQKDFLASVDIKAAYLHIFIFPPYQKIFCSGGPTHSICGFAVQHVHSSLSVHQGPGFLSGVPGELASERASPLLLVNTAFHIVHPLEKVEWVLNLQKSAFNPKPEVGIFRPDPGYFPGEYSSFQTNVLL